MTASSLNYRGPGAKCRPPLELNEHERLLGRLRAWEPLALDVVLDDLEAVLGEHADPAEPTGLAERLQGTLRQLVNIACSQPDDRIEDSIAETVQRARALTSKDSREGAAHAPGRLRRLAMVTLDLLELLIAGSHIKDIG